MLSPGMEEQYFDIGRRALELVVLAGQVCEGARFQDILDLPCGHGRVLRWLRARYPEANLTACDLDHAGVDFCRDQFDATGVYSEPDLRALAFKDQFDLVWCGSLLTHLSPAAWLHALDCLIRATRDGGVIVFSIQGRFFTSLLARGQGNISENIDKAALLRNFSREGHAFEPYFEATDRNYGIAVTSPEAIGRLIQCYNGVVVRTYMERAWGIQDIVILHKREGYFEPLLGGAR